jgi:4,5-DOPA dioxygenase extradiol
MEKPKTIHDFGGFPRALYQVSYPAPGSPDLAALTQTAVQKVHVQPDQNWGLDHGAWSVLRRMFPAADIPVVQLSLDYSQAPEYHYALGKELLALRRRGILILGSGNIVHNLGMVIFNDDRAYEWALEFDTLMKDLILAGNHDSIIHYEKLGKNAQLSIPTNEHFLPLLYILALQQETEQVHFFAERVNFGSLSMRSIRID